MLDLMLYKEAKEFLDKFPDMNKYLNDAYQHLVSNYSQDATVRTIITDMEAGIDRLNRKALYYRTVVEKK